MRHSPLPKSVDALPALEPAFWTVVNEGLVALDLALTPGTRAAIDAHARLLVAWNAAINLTALRTAEAIARGHVLDSLSALATCRKMLARSGRSVESAGLLELGSGGGYPGLPLGLALGVGRLALVDSVQKKARFLQVAAHAAVGAKQSAGETAPAVVALAERAEDLADEPDQREAWDLIVARALGSLAEVVELGLPLTTVGGHVVAWKRDTDTAPVVDEIRAARPLVQAAGGGRPFVEHADPHGRAGLSGHVLVIVRKARPTPDRYPRPAAERRRALLG